jgi:hypothetical protein
MILSMISKFSNKKIFLIMLLLIVISFFYMTDYELKDVLTYGVYYYLKGLRFMAQLLFG